MLYPTAYSAAAVRFPANMCCILVPSDFDELEVLAASVAESLLVNSANQVAEWVQAPLTLTPKRVVNPSALRTDETLDWDAFIAVAPQRQSGTLAVTLKFVDRKGPPPIEDSWD